MSWPGKCSGRQSGPAGAKTVHDELVELLGARLQNLILGRQTRRNHARRSSGFGQDDFRGQAGQSFAQGQENPLSCAGRRLSASGHRAAQGTCPPAGNALLWHGSRDEACRYCQKAAAEARESGANVVLLDTAGRLHVDEVLMDELLRHQRKPSIRAKSCLWPMQ